MVASITSHAVVIADAASIGCIWMRVRKVAPGARGGSGWKNCRTADTTTRRRTGLKYRLDAFVAIGSCGLERIVDRGPAGEPAQDGSERRVGSAGAAFAGDRDH
jgi:hypothetical protein